MDYAGRSDSATVLSNGQVILPQLRFQQHIGSKWILFVCVSQHKCQDAWNFCSAGDSCRLKIADETFPSLHPIKAGALSSDIAIACFESVHIPPDAISRIKKWQLENLKRRVPRPAAGHSGPR